jgi:hypothetical protein
MALVSELTKSIDISHEPGQSVVIKRLSWKQKDKAIEARRDRALSNMRAMGGDVLAALRDVKTEDVNKVEADPLSKYDTGVLLHAGIKSWSYPVPVSEKAIDALDDETAEFIAREIAKFAERARTEEQEKNA